MYTPPIKKAKYQSKPVNRSDKVAGLQKDLALAKVNPKTFESGEYSAIIRHPTQAFSLGNTGELQSILWLNANIAKILIRNPYQLRPAEAVEKFLAHIMRYNE
jgi:hypothetical protein